MLRGLDSGLTVVGVSSVGHSEGDSMWIGTGPSLGATGGTEMGESSVGTSCLLD